MDYFRKGIFFLQLLGFCCTLTLQQQDVPPVVLGDFESLPGGRGNIAEFAKALRLPSNLAEKNIVQFYKEGNTYYHRFLFDNSSHILAFPFTFGDLKTLQSHDKTIDYVYNLEPTGDPYRATIFSRYEERNGPIRFTVEAVFRRTGMVVTYTHSDVLDSIMARRSYRRIVPKSALGYYENSASLESTNFKEFVAALPLPQDASYGPKNKIHLGQSGQHFMIKYLLDPESSQISIPFTVGEKQKRLILGKPFEYIVDVEKGDYLNSTILRAQFRQENSDLSYTLEFAIDGKAINATYKRKNIVASRYYRRALPLHFYGTFVAVPTGQENFAEFSSIFQDSSIGVAESPTKMKFYRQSDIYHQEITNIFGMTESLDVPFQFDAHTEHEFLGNSFKIKYYYDGGEKPTLHGSFQNLGGDKSFTANYTFSGNGIMAVYMRDTPIGPVVAKQFYRRQLPTIILGRYESVDNTEDFKTFANGIFFPELTSKTTMEYLERNGTYVQKFSYGPGVHTSFQEVPFRLGEKQELLVKGKWMMEYTYNAWEGERTFLLSVFNEKRSGSSGPAFGEFSRVGDFSIDGFTSVYTLGNLTAKRTYRRVA